MNTIMTRLFTAISFAMFLYGVFMSAKSFLAGYYAAQLLYIGSSVLSYISFRHFVNNSNEEDIY